MKWSKIVIIGTMSASLLLASACGNAEEAKPVAPAEEATPQQTTPQEQEAIAPVAPAYTAPLTGMPLDEPLTGRPLAVMINNAPAARPQSGLTDADIIYEVLAEGGVTRLVAIFQSHMEAAKIGPIRSIRPYMIDVGESYHGVLVHAGASNDAYAILQRQHKEDLDEITNASRYFWRDKSRKPPHNLYSNPEKLLEGAAKRKYAIEDTKVPGYSFYKEDETPVSGEPVSKLEVKFQLSNYKVSYEYDPASKQYKRLINGKPHTDLETGEQLKATNVVVMGADHKVMDEIGRLDVDLELGGEALLFQHGQMIRAQWIRRADDIIRFIKDNKELPFYPGNTMINVVPNSPNFDSHVKTE